MSTQSFIPTVDFFGHQVSKIGFGAMDCPSSTALVTRKNLRRRFEPASNTDMYGSGENEKLLAPFLKSDRDRIFICTKFGIVRGPGGSFAGLRGDPEYVKSACEASLKRLGVDVIDLYYQHRVDPNTPIEDTVRALKELQTAGKIRYIGLSECSADTLRRASKIAKIHAVQWEYSVFTPDVETNGVLDACKELDVKLVAYSPLGRGIIGCTWKSSEEIPEGDFRKALPRFQGDAFHANMKLVEGLKEIAAKKNITANQLALAWVMDQGAIPIPGTKRVKYLEDNNQAVSVNISKDEHEAIRKLMKDIQIKGDRYHDMTNVNA
ncbi:Voltage-gated shaker-like K channel, subunit beta/KCNAB [Phaffia rhodozyma]|uniref:Voltage-gated shaker-like K channel, subunit beta/KCNAB n=1 Tax=Phaffia rhodozyma TaxID=264483 RepID=A0A0F7SQ82_PHARH|nr:Voltage-gated shaker-like K channel, subunit beta/KCNAB [Phaffia rhodozyma]